MSFYNEIANIIGLEWASIATGFSYINYNNQAVYIEGVKNVVSITADEICVAIKSGRLYVFGEHLSVFLLENNSIILKGDVVNIGKESFKKLYKTINDNIENREKVNAYGK